FYLFSSLFPYTTLFRSAHFALQFFLCLDYSLFRCLKQWGVHSTGVAGEGNAVFMAAFVAGAISLEDAFALTVISHQITPEQLLRSEEHTSELQSLRHLV